MEYIMMLLFTNIEPFFIFIQSLLGGGAESCGKNRIRQKLDWRHIEDIFNPHTPPRRRRMGQRWLAGVYHSL